MGLLGRYTTYVGGAATEAHKLLSKLFPAGPFATAVTQGDELAAQAIVKAAATAKVDSQGVSGLQPSDGIQAGDKGMFPTGVDLTFGTAPDVSAVKWTKAGDPANPYAPDITSPGPGKTEGLDKSVDPQISADDINPNPSIADTKNPSVLGNTVFRNNTIGTAQKPGDSGGNV